MSGGHFDYGYFAISQFAEELRHELSAQATPDSEHLTSLQRKTTVSRLEKCRAIIAVAGELAREVEWLYSGDTGDESFAKLVDPILANVVLKEGVYKYVRKTTDGFGD